MLRRPVTTSSTQDFECLAQALDSMQGFAPYARLGDVFKVACESFHYCGTLEDACGRFAARAGFEFIADSNLAECRVRRCSGKDATSPSGAAFSESGGAPAGHEADQ